MDLAGVDVRGLSSCPGLIHREVFSTSDRLSSPLERDQLQGDTTDNEQNLQELHTQVQTTAGQGEQAKMRMKPPARKQAPDLSVLDEIFS